MVEDGRRRRLREAIQPEGREPPRPFQAGGLAVALPPLRWDSESFRQAHTSQFPRRPWQQCGLEPVPWCRTKDEVTYLVSVNQGHGSRSSPPKAAGIRFLHDLLEYPVVRSLSGSFACSSSKSWTFSDLFSAVIPSFARTKTEGRDKLTQHVLRFREWGFPWKSAASCSFFPHRFALPGPCPFPPEGLP